MLVHYHKTVEYHTPVKLDLSPMLDDTKWGIAEWSMTHLTLYTTDTDEAKELENFTTILVEVHDKLTEAMVRKRPDSTELIITGIDHEPHLKADRARTVVTHWKP